MSEIAFCFVSDEDLEEGNSWDFTTKSFTWEVFGRMEQYDGVLSAAEQQIAEPASGGAPAGLHLTPAQFEEALALAADLARRYALPPPTPEGLAESIRERNERWAQQEREYQAAQPWIRQPAELLAVLQKMEHHLRATKPDWDLGDGDFLYDPAFEQVYAFLRRAIRQHRLVHWEYFV